MLVTYLTAYKADGLKAHAPAPQSPYLRLMASLSQWQQNTFQQQSPMSWQLAPILQQEAMIGANLGESTRRLQRDFTQYDLPDLVSNQAARGAFHSGATRRKTGRLYDSMVESGGDLARNAAYSLAGLGQRKVGVTTGGGF